MPFTDEQISGMTPEQRQQAITAIKAELARRSSAPTSGISTIPNRGFSVRGAVLGGLKSLVGESPDLTPKEDVATAMNEFIAKERLKQQIAGEAPKTPQDLKAEMDIEEAKAEKSRQEQLRQEKEREETGQVSSTQPESVTTPILEKITTKGIITDEMPDSEYQTEWSEDAKGNLTRKRVETEASKVRRELWKSQQTEANKPYGEVEANVVSKAKPIADEIDKLIAMVEKPGNIYGGTFPVPGLPFGGSRMGAFLKEGPWQSTKRGLTAGKGREAGLLLNKIKILAFGEGGKALTEGEKATIFANLDPSYKTEEQWIESLKFAKKLIEDKAKLMTKKSTTSITNTKSGTLSTGMTYIVE